VDTTPRKDNEAFDPLAEGSLDEPDEADEDEDEPAAVLEHEDPSLQ
jgi:hypothetical protein